MFEALLILSSATVLLLGSPGPVPISLAATGATFGARQGLPFLLGILAGLAVVIIGSAAGLGALFTQFPSIKLFCQLVGATYLCFIAYKIATMPLMSGEEADNAPSAIDGFILNLLNPKAYAAFISIFSQFMLPMTDTLTSSVVTGLVCFIIAIIVDSLWLIVGSLFKSTFLTSKYARHIRVLLALLLVSAVLYTLLN